MLIEQLSLLIIERGVEDISVDGIFVILVVYFWRQYLRVTANFNKANDFIAQDR